MPRRLSRSVLGTCLLSHLRKGESHKNVVLATKNRIYAFQNCLTADTIADMVRKCIAKDYSLTEKHHKIDDKRYVTRLATFD